MAKPTSSKSELLKSIITIIMIIVFFPIGLLLMWLITTWPKWLKIVITLIFLGLMLLGFLTGFLGTISTHKGVLERDSTRYSAITQITQAIGKEVEKNNSVSFCTGKVPCNGDSTEPNATYSDGTGWVKIKLPSLSSLPIDPLNSAQYRYTYCSDGQDFEVNVRFEAEQNISKATDDKGDNSDIYEVGTKLTLCK